MNSASQSGSIVRNPPNPDVLSSSIGEIGYSLETAVADIVDNSIEAGASEIEVIVSKTKDGSRYFLAVWDDGCGMDGEELVEAMKFGSSHTQKKDAKTKLGCFGLGLKSASFSQARKLIVFSKKEEAVCGFSWDKKILQETKEWLLFREEEERLEEFGLSDLMEGKGSGTLVIWEGLGFEERLEKEYQNVLRKICRHLSLAFHRFLEEGAFTISMNGRRLAAINPFFEGSPGHPETFSETRYPPAAPSPMAKLKLFLLPPGALSDSRDFSPEESFLMQGFFVYRNKRLLTWGGWLGLKGLEAGHEFSSCRILVDIGAGEEAGWRLDVCKSKISPPEKLKPWLSRWAVFGREKAAALYLPEDSPGKKSEKREKKTLWSQKRGRLPSADLSNPLAEAMRSLALAHPDREDIFRGILNLMCWSLMKEKKAVGEHVFGESEEEVLALLMAELVKRQGKEKALDEVRGSYPFCQWTEFLESIINGIKDV